MRTLCFLALLSVCLMIPAPAEACGHGAAAVVLVQTQVFPQLVFVPQQQIVTFAVPGAVAFSPGAAVVAVRGRSCCSGSRPELLQRRGGGFQR